MALAVWGPGVSAVTASWLLSAKASNMTDVLGVRVDTDGFSRIIGVNHTPLRTTELVRLLRAMANELEATIQEEEI